MTEDNFAKEQIYIAVDIDHFPEKGFELATTIANKHEKDICLLLIASNHKIVSTTTEECLQTWCQQHASKVNKQLHYHILEDDDDFTDFLERNEAAAVIFELTDKGVYRNCKGALKLCRELRIPYYFVKSNQSIDFDKVLVPIGFLVEEREKGVFCSGMGRFFHSEILLMTANDYGSRAKQNTESIQSLLDKFSITYQFITAKKDSFKVEFEAMDKASELHAGLLLISASRDYGLDDIIFGPKEQKVIQKSTIPVMVINPRKDLYALCS